MHGLGRISYDEGPNYYIGHFLNGMKEGQGIMMLPKSNFCYEGEWHKNEMHGQGKIKFYNEDVYIGGFKHHHFHGKV